MCYADDNKPAQVRRKYVSGLVTAKMTSALGVTLKCLVRFTCSTATIENANEIMNIANPILVL